MMGFSKTRRIAPWSSLAAVLASLWMASALGAQPASPPYLLHDLQTDPFNGQIFSPDKTTVVFDDSYYYVADDGIHGLELWRSDGTPGGTELVRDICPGWCTSRPARLTVAGDWLFFTADDGETGTELWKTDGTDQGTVRVADINPGPQSSRPWNVSALGGVLLFSAHTNDQGFEKWRSDGTAQGTYSLGDLNPGEEGSDPSQAVVLGGIAVFGGRVDQRFWQERLFRTDGTIAGTWELFDFEDDRPGLSFDGRPWLVTGDIAYFGVRESSSRTTRTWRTDGTGAGTVPLDPLDPLGVLGGRDWQASRGLLFVAGSNSSGGSGGSVWVSDGTAIGTVELTPTQGCFPHRLTGTDVGLFFSCGDPVFGVELWFSDGTIAGTARIEDLSPGRSNFTFWGEMLPVPGGVIVSGRRDPQGQAESWFSDGTPGSASLVPIPTAYGDQRSELLRGKILFWGGSRHQLDLFLTDGSSANTLWIGREHRQSSSYPSWQSSIDFFRSYFTTRPRIWSWFTPNINGWVLDTSRGMTESSVSAFEWSSGPPFVLAAGRVFFSTYPFKRDPASSLAGQLLSVSPDLDDDLVLSQQPGYQLHKFGGQLYRVARQPFPGGFGLDTIDPWTGRIASIPGPSVLPDHPDYLTEWLDVGERLFLPTSQGVWSIDRQGSTEDHLPSVQNSDAHAESLSGDIFFTADNAASGREVWSLDLDTGDTRLLEVRPGADSGVFRVPPTHGGNVQFAAVALGERYLFAADDGSSGVELWATTVDGPPYLLADIAPGSDGSYPQELTVVGGRALFRANDGVNGSELWATDGTPQGTFLLRDLRPGARSSLPQELQVVDGLLVFTAFDEEHGRELWLSDGTVLGTQLHSDIAPGKLSSSPNSLLAQPGALLFSANDAQRGFELWAVDRPLRIDGGALFRTGFESGNLGSWSSQSTAGSRLSPTPQSER